MAIPIRDINPTRSFPFVTRTLVFVNVVIFIYELLNPEIVDNYSFIPALAWDQWYRWITHMFLHGGLLHIVGNMIYLWVFGDNVEDAYGHGRFLILYLFWGIAAAFAQYMSVEAEGDPRYMWIPAIGASGAISGVLGAYLVLYPNARIVTLILFFVITLVKIPAWAYIGFWFIYQLFYGALELITVAPSGVAYWAHIGGFIAGVITALAIRPKHRRVYY